MTKRNVYFSCCSSDSISFFPEAVVVSDVPEDSVLIKGASAGAVTLVAPSDNSVANNATSAVVAIENAEESSTPIKETIGVASANAVIGPSTGPVIIAGPTAPPLPIPVSTTEQPVAVPAIVVETNSESVSVASTAAANLSVSEDGSGLATGERSF